uniref:sigma-54 interaction domain-containing protein n=1 Tax=uncultured Bilophila sp. TaxID=529385 RepID=UPI0025DF737E|nr:sigma 54-interacting transcriptional regulator [uncultured Bilophila sp.]
MNIPFSITSDEDFTRLLEDPLFLRMLDALSIGISITDPTGTVRYLSKSCYEIYGMDPSESAVGKKIDELFRTGKAGVLSSLATRRVNTVASISYNGIEALCRRYPIVDDAGNLVCCVSEVIATTHENSRIDELLRSLQQLKRKSGYFISQEPTHGGGLRTFEDLVGDTSAMQELKKMGVRFARSREPVLILGESGTGKELFAQAIHRASPRANGSFVSVNCAALPRELAESELFGYVEGAFTGAKKGGKKGKFELANNGTIFLDEIGELPLHLQAKLLRVLESNEIQKIGMGESEYSDFRLIAATNRSLPELVRRRQFREDLYHRLNILELRLPPLREHRGDIPALIMQLIEGICGPQKALEVHLSPEVLELFMLYRWPGNIRELKNVLAYAYCCMDEDELELTPRHLPERLLSGQRGETPSVEVQGNFSFQAMQEETEKRAIESVLTVTGGNKTRAAKLLGFSRNTLYLKMKALGIPSRKA